MAHYYLYRLKQEEFEKLADLKKIGITYRGKLEYDDVFVVFVSGIMKVLGTYKKLGKQLVGLKVAERERMPKMQDFYSELSIISFVNDRTYKVFAKPVKEITKADFELFEEALKQ